MQNPTALSLEFEQFMRRERWFRLPVIAVVTLLISKARSVLLGDPDEDYWVALFYSFIIWNGIAYTYCQLARRLPEMRQTGLRLLLLLAFILVFITCIKLVGDFVELCAGQEPEITMLREWLFAVLVSILITGVYETIHLFYLWKAALRESDQLKLAKAQTEFQALREQVNPHFLFNSLNTLATLIPEDPDLAVQFTQRLSEVYRYVLQSKNHDLVTLETELSFVRSYLFLLSIRHGDNIQAEIKVEEAYREASLPPLALQLLVENATKHNVVSASKPLLLRIYTDGDNVIVRNNRQPKLTASKGTGTGLENIAKRYYHLVKKEIKIYEGKDDFTVTLPLIDVSRYHDEGIAKPPLQKAE